MALISLSSYSEVMDVASQLSSKSDSMRELLEQVANLYKNNIGEGGETWTGTAAQTARDEFDTLSEKFPEFSEAVNDCCEYLNQVAANYQAVDAAIQAAAQGQQ